MMKEKPEKKVEQKTETEKEPDPIVETYTKKVKQLFLEWLSLDNDEDFCRGGINTIVKMAKEMKLDKKNLVIELSFSDLMQAIKRFETLTVDDPPEEKDV